MTAPGLPHGYLLGHLAQMLGVVLDRDLDLLHPEEVVWFEGFRVLDADARHLVARLLTRKGPWFRAEDLVYAEVRDRAAGLAQLRARGYAEGPDQASLGDLLGLCTREDLGACLERFGHPVAKSLGRGPREARLRAEVPEDLLRADLATALAPLRLAAAERWELLRLLYFGNGSQDLSAFVTAELGQVQWEPTVLDRTARAFSSRREVDFLLHLRKLQEALEAAPGARDLRTQATEQLLGLEVPPGVRTERRFHRLLAQLGRAWERVGEPDWALACYGACALPPAREREVRIRAGQGAWSEALALARAMAAEPRDVGEETFARAFLVRAARRHPEAAAWVAAHPAPPAVPERSLELPRREGVGVEAAALAAAREEGWEGFFSENLLWRALFGLVCWDELFAPVPGAFMHPFQAAPLDLGSPAFYARREAAFAARLAALGRPGALAARVLSVARSRWGRSCHFVGWRHLALDRLQEAACRIPPPVAQMVLGTMARQPLAFDRGFPDLFLYRPGAPDWQLWEVKGPGDTLRPEQARWLGVFQGLGVQVYVVRVAWQDTERPRDPGILGPSGAGDGD